MQSIKKMQKFTEMKEQKTSFNEKSSLKDERKKKRFKLRKILSNKESALITLIVILLIVLGVVGYLYIQEKRKVEDPTQVATEEAQRIKEKVGELILLPEDEEPTIATIIDVDALKTENPEFYKNASNGDKLLIYSQKAIIYSPERDLIINVAPIIRQPGEEEATTETEEQETEDENQSLTVELRNGSSLVGATSAYEDQIGENLGDKYNVTAKVNAANKNYTGVVVYDLTGGEKSELAQALTDELSATMKTTLPTGEADSDAEVVVIIGN